MSSRVRDGFDGVLLGADREAAEKLGRDVSGVAERG